MVVFNAGHARQMHPVGGYAAFCIRREFRKVLFIGCEMPPFKSWFGGMLVNTSEPSRLLNEANL